MILLIFLVADERVYECKESLEELKFKIGNLKVELREEMLKADASRDVCTSSYVVVQPCIVTVLC